MTPFAFLEKLRPMDLAVLAGICLLFFGNRLPGVLLALGQGVDPFKKGVRGDNGQDGPFSIP